jgi:hypothetical protein
MALAERVNDPGMLMEALFMQGVTMFYRGEYADCQGRASRRRSRLTTIASARKHGRRTPVTTPASPIAAISP